MLPPEPDVIAYDENMGVLFQWSGCPDASDVSDLPKGGLAGIAIQRAHLIRRRDGLVLKGESPEEYSDEIVLPTEEVKRKPRELKRVELIPPPAELEEHEPLSNEQLLKVGLWVLLEESELDSLVIEDRDIVSSLAGGLITVERCTGGMVVLRAHHGSLDVISVADEAPRPRKRTQKKVD